MAIHLKPYASLLVLVLTIAATINEAKGDDRVEFVPHPARTLSPDQPITKVFSEPETSRQAREAPAPVPRFYSEKDDGESARLFQSARVPKLVQMLTNFDLSAAVNSNSDSMLRSGFDPHSTLTDTEPLWDKSLKRIEDFVAATRELKQLSAEIKALFEGNVQIMDAMTKDTNTNFIGFFN